MAKYGVFSTKMRACLGVLSLLTVLVLGACASDTSDQAAEAPRLAVLQDLFTEQGSTHFVGTQENPLFTTGTPLLTDDRLYFPDYLGHKVLIYDQAGAYLTQWGTEGEGPGEFQMPYSIAVDHQGNIYINDRGNQRVQIFDPLGTLLRTVATPGQNEHIFVSRQESATITVLGVARCGAKPCLMQEYDSDTGRRRKIFAEFDEKTIYLHSWVATHDRDRRLYIANVLTPVIEVYSAKGKRQRVIELASPSMIPVDASQISDNPFEQVKWFKTNQYTMLASLSVHDDYIFVQHRRKNLPGQGEFVLDVYGLDGTLKFFGVETTGYLASVEGDTFYFVDRDERDYGSVTISKYVLESRLALLAQSQNGG